VREQAAEVRRLISGSTVYQPRRSYTVGEEVIFPALRLAKGPVTQVRPGYNPEYGDFNVIRLSGQGKNSWPILRSVDSDSGVLTEQMAGDAEDSAARAIWRRDGARR
jgi:hypothetical protein